MRSFQGSRPLDPVPGDVVATLGRIDRAAGAEASHVDQLPQLLTALRERARIESVAASSAIEGVVVEESRVPTLVAGADVRYRDRSEAEFAGYTAALDYLSQDEPMDLSVGIVLHVHHLLFSFTEGGGGSFKTDDNLVVDRRSDGTRVVRFEPVSARETPFFTEELITRTRGALKTGDQHPLVITAAFALDIACIHPFEDGNGRVARLLTSHLLQHTGYGVGRYVSLEQLIFDTKEEYYASLHASTLGWFDDGNHDPWPWSRYLLTRLAEAYERFEARVASDISGGTKQGRVRDFVLLRAPATFAISDIRRALPGVSDNTIRIVLAELKGADHIANDGTGRSATWRRLRG